MYVGGGDGKCLHNFTLTPTRSFRRVSFARLLRARSRFPLQHTGNNISRNSSACKVKQQNPQHQQFSISEVLRAFFPSSDVWSDSAVVCLENGRRKRPRVTAVQMTINAKINLPSSCVVLRRGPFVGDSRARQTSGEVRKRRTIPLLSSVAKECIISLRLCLLRTTSGSFSLETEAAAAVLSRSIKFRLSWFCWQHSRLVIISGESGKTL